MEWKYLIGLCPWARWTKCPKGGEACLTPDDGDLSRLNTGLWVIDKAYQF